MWTRPSDLSEQPETGATCAIGIRSSDQAGIWVPALTKEPAPRASRLTRWGKKLNGRKRHILVDTQGNLMVVIVHPANISDRDGADWVLEEAIRKHGRLRHIWADSGYSGELVEWWQDEHGITIEIVGKQPNQRTFVVAPRRWVVERTFANLGRARRLSKDYEHHDIFSESMVYLASIGSLLRRLTRNAVTATRYHVISTADGY